jgi:hypothetical protein
MTRRSYRPTVEMFLEVGPDTYHPTKLGPLTWDEALEALQTTFGEMRRRVYQDTAFGARWEEKLHEAVATWNGGWAAEEGHDGGEGWKWLGILFSGRIDDELWINMSRMTGEPAHCEVILDLDAVEAKATEAAKRAMEVLAEVVTKPRRNDDE